MNVDIYYAGRRSSAKFLVVPAGTNVPDLRFPHDPDLDHPDLNGLRLFALDVPADLIGADLNDVDDQIRAKGYAVCDSTIGPGVTAN